jgi:hypothetical protein
MGYRGTLTQIYYLDLTTHRVKSALSAKFDESGVGVGPPTPNTLQLRAALDGKDLPATDQEIQAPSELGLVIKNSPFVKLKRCDLQVCCDNPTFDMRVDMCSPRGRVYLSSIGAHSTGARLRGWRQNYVGSYIVELNKYAIFTVEHFHNAYNPALPHIPLTKRPIYDIEFQVPYPADTDQLVGYMDAAHGTCMCTHRSVGGGSSVFLEQLSCIAPC